MSEPPDPLIGAVVDDRWRVTERLGEGGMGTVYRGERLKLGKRVALKFLHPSYALSKGALARFDREARAISLLTHAHCVSIIDFGVHRGRPFIVMEYVAGQPLSRVMGKREMAPARAVNIMRQMLDALRHAHAHGVVHRDLKPDNVMLAEVTGTEDYVKILDFGLARIISVDEPSISLPEIVAGTPSWMSPEQASGHKVDHRSDIFSAGVILYAMVTGKRPFRHENTAELLRQVREMAPTPPRKLAPAVSDPLERVILKAMAKSPDERFYTAADFLTALDRTPEAKALARPAPRKSRPMLRIAIALAFIGAGAGGAYLFASASSNPPKPIVLEPRVIAPKPIAPIEPKPIALAPRPISPEPAHASPEPEPAHASPEPEPAIASPEPVAAKPAVDPARAAIAALIDGGQLEAADLQLRALVQKSPSTAWAHLALGEVYFRRIWRADALKSWEEALRLDPELRHDRQLGDHLCVALGPKWQGGGARLLVSRFADELVPTLERCLASVDDYPRLQTAARLLERAAGRQHVDRGLVALRTLELSPNCEERRAAVRTLARLHDARAINALERLHADACLAPVIPLTLDKLR